MHKLFEDPQGSGTSRQNSRDIPDSSLSKPKEDKLSSLRVRARTFRPPPLCIQDPPPHRAVSGPKKSISVLFFSCLKEVSSSRARHSLKPTALTAKRSSSLRRSSSQPRDWKSFGRDFSEARGGSGGSFREGGLDFLEVALVWKFPDGSLSKQTSKKFASEPPKLLRGPSRSGSRGGSSQHCLTHAVVL